MTIEQVSKVVDKYRVKLSKMVDNRNSQADFDSNPSRGEALQHLLGMCWQMDEMLVKGQLEKVMRWLGFMQGVLWIHGVYTLNEMREHNTNG